MISFEDVRPDLKRYYKPELNDGKLMSEFKRGEQADIVLICDVCSTTIKKTPQTYGVASNGRFRAFKCKKCISLGGRFPELSKQWSDKNKKTPFETKSHSREKVWWKCENGHEWKATVMNRTSLGRGCPSCKLSKGERTISDFLIENKIKHIHQHRIDSKIYDFYLPDEQIYVEIHGIQHFEEVPFFKKRTLHEQQAIDKEKQAYAEANGQYIMVDYREHDPELALERFLDAMAELA